MTASVAAMAALRHLRGQPIPREILLPAVVIHRANHAAWLVPIGILAALGQWCMTRAYSRGSTLLVANLQYAGIVLGALYGLLLFGDQIPLLGWAGMGVIMASGIAATVLRTRALGQTPAEEH